MTKSEMEYVSLHHHTTFSYMDGFGTPEQHVARTADLGMRAQAATEHGNVSSHVRHESAAAKHGIKPIYGCELYTAAGDMRETGNRSKWHLTVLAENEEGYRNLNRLVTRSWAEGFYQWPTVSGEMLADHSDGLIVLSGCADSKLACDLLGGKGREKGSERDAVRTLQSFKEMFGDRYYLEAQQFPELARTRQINSAYEEFSKRYGVPLVATADCHYPMPDDNEMQKILHAAGRNIGSVAAAEASWEYNIRLTVPTSDAEILRRLRGTGLSSAAAGQAVRSTGEIADRVDVTLPRAELLRFPLPRGYSSARDLFWDWLRRGWEYRWADNEHMRRNWKEYRDRIKYEAEMIESKDFIDYFLMLSDVVRYSKNAGIPVGPARGSAAASAICYFLRITEVDPLQYPTMVFERFIDITRMDLPDIDLDFADDRRDEVRQHLIDLYGADRVGNIGNFVRYRGKNAVNDVARVYHIPQAEAAVINGLVIERSGGDSRFDASLSDTFDMFPQAKAVLDRHPEFAQSVRLEGNYKGMSVHAAGLVVANTPLSDVCAVYTRTTGKDKREVSVLAYDKKDAEAVGILKIDALSLSTMGMIAIAIESIGMSLEELYRIPMTEPETLAAFKANDVVGIFQFGERATRLVCADVQPDNFLELADINALSRPGPLFSGATAAYVDVKHKRKPPEHLHPAVDEITRWSNYQIIYQEQILRIVREVGDFPWTAHAAIRKVISQKKGEAAFNEMQVMFVDGAKRLHGIEKPLALKIWSSLVTSGTYAFNVAHCISYSMLAFWCMWLKVHHPVAFYTAQLRKTKKENWGRLIRDAEKHGVSVVAPDLVRAGVTWAPDFERREVVAGFSQIPRIGEKLADVIIADRAERGPFESWPALQRVKGVGPVMVKVVREFAESDDPFGLDLVNKVLEEVRREIRSGEYPGIPAPTHRSDEIPSDADNLHVVWVGVVKSKEYKDYVEDQRSRSGQDVEEILRGMKDRHLVTSCVLRSYDDGEEEVYLRFNRWKFPSFKAPLEELRENRDVVVAVGKKRRGFGVGLHVERLYVIDPEEVDDEDDDEGLGEES